MLAPRSRTQIVRLALPLIAALAAVGCGTTEVRTVRVAAKTTAQTNPFLRAHPHAIQPSAGAPSVQSAASSPSAAIASSDPVGDPNAHAPPLSEVRRELHLELVSVRKNSATYINPLHYVTCCGVWERTDMGVDATMPVGAPILAPCRVKILAIEPNWYAGQPLIYFELLEGPQAGKVQYVAEEITQLARPGAILQQGQPVARFAASGTGIEYGWATPSGVTLAVATTGYEEGQETPAGKWMRAWLNSLGANAGPNT